MNGHRFKLGVGSMLLIVSGIVAWYVNTQARVNEVQDVRIEKKVDRLQYYRDIDQIFKQLDQIIKWVKP